MIEPACLGGGERERDMLHLCSVGILMYGGTVKLAHRERERLTQVHSQRADDMCYQLHNNAVECMTRAAGSSLRNSYEKLQRSDHTIEAG